MRNCKTNTICSLFTVVALSCGVFLWGGSGSAFAQSSDSGTGDGGSNNGDVSAVDDFLGDVDSAVGEVNDFLGDVNDIAGDVDNFLDSLLSSVETFLNNVGGYKDEAVDAVREVIGGIGGIIETIDDLKSLIGDLGLPNIEEIVDDIWADLLASGAVEGDLDKTTPKSDPVNDLNAAVLTRSLETVLEIESSRLESDKVLSEESQEALATEMARIQDLAVSAADLAEGTARLSQDSYSSFGASNEIVTTSEQVAADSEQLDSTAQGAVSTQDVVKGLTAVSANISEQMASQSKQLLLLSDQSSAQSSQASNIAQLLANQSQIDAASLYRTNQMAVGVSVMQRNIAGLQDIQEGDRQAAMIRRSLMSHSSSSLASQAFKTIR